jgi:F-type H+-transporting ATPase subunit epsilon
VLGEGEVRINGEGGWKSATIDGGFLSVDHDRVTIIAESVDASGMSS